MPRRDMTYRVVPLESDEARDARLGSTVAERVEMVMALSIAAWVASGKPLPKYERHNIPFRLSYLHEQGGPNDR